MGAEFSKLPVPVGSILNELANRLWLILAHRATTETEHLSPPVLKGSMLLCECPLLILGEGSIHHNSQSLPLVRQLTLRDDGNALWLSLAGMNRHTEQTQSNTHHLLYMLTVGVLVRGMSQLSSSPTSEMINGWLCCR